MNLFKSELSDSKQRWLIDSDNKAWQKTIAMPYPPLLRPQYQLVPKDWKRWELPATPNKQDISVKSGMFAL